MRNSIRTKVLGASCIALLSTGLPGFAEKPGETIYQRGFLSEEAAHKSIELPDGYSLELVLSDPNIEEPVACAFDGNGVLYNWNSRIPHSHC